MLFLNAVIYTTPGMFILGVFSIVEHKEHIIDHIKLMTVCVICSWIFGGVYLSKYMNGRMGGLSAENVVMLMFIGSSMASVMMDILWQEIYEIVWVICIGAGAVVMIAANHLSIDAIISLLILFFVQEAIMSRAYGKADCHAFCCSGLYFAIHGLTMEYWVLQIFVAFAMLVVSQLSAGNINRKLKLRHPVPMIPYITAGMFVVMACSK